MKKTRPAFNITDVPEGLLKVLVDHVAPLITPEMIAEIEADRNLSCDEYGHRTVELPVPGKKVYFCSRCKKSWDESTVGTKTTN